MKAIDRLLECRGDGEQKAFDLHCPTVSVLMAVYNTERFLERAVESILQQSFRDFELVILDDGSTDRSLSILRRYAAQDQRIRLISRENRGIPQTRNELLREARGEFIAVMDSDDVALPDRLARQVAFLQQSPEVVWVGGAFELIDRGGRLITKIPLAEQDSEIKALLQDGHISFLHPTALIRRSAVLQVGGYDESLPLAEDLDLWLRLGEIGALANLPEPVVQYRLHGNSICDRYQGLPPQAVQTALDRAWQKGMIREKPQVTMVCAWRPKPDRPSRHAFALKYGWWAFSNRQRQTAIRYGIQAIVLNPGSIESWNLLACALIKPFPAS
jgi:hypothetical protein